MGIRSRAQNFEDVMLWRAVGGVETGFFIDVGAQHPIKDSVSKIFSEQGWRGIHVEPTPEYANLLREDRPGETVISAAISARAGPISFFAITGTGLSTGNRDIAEAHAAAGYPYHEITVPTLSLDDLLALAPSDDIHWMKIDVEGMERDVLESWHLSPRRPWIVVIEANLPGSQVPSHEKWEALILAKGYHATYYDGLNRFYVSDDHHELDRNFELPPNIFDGFQFDPSSDHAVILNRLHEAEIEALESRIAGLEARLADMRLETDALGQQWQHDTEQRISDIRRESAAELANAYEREASRTEAVVAEIIARERDTAIAASAKQSELEQQIATLRKNIETERALAQQHEAELLAAIEEMRVATAAEMTLRTEASLQDAMLRADLQARLEEAARREVEAAAASKRESDRLVRDAEAKIAQLETLIAEMRSARVSLEHDLADTRDRIDTLRDAMAAREKELLAQGFEAANRVREIEVARFEARLVDERALLLASEERAAAVKRQVTDMQRALEQAHQDAARQEYAARDRIDTLRDVMAAREKELLAQGFEAANRVREIEAARFEARLADERALLLASEERVAAAKQQVSDMQHVLERAHQNAAAQEHAARARMEDALECLRVQARQDAEELRAEARQNVERLRVESEALLADTQALLADTQARLSGAEHMAAERAEAYQATILEQAEAFRAEIARITDAAAERERQAHSRIEQVQRREQDSVAAVHLEKNALLAHLMRSNARMAAVMASRSWKLSAPLRWLLRESSIDYSLMEPAPMSSSLLLMGADFISNPAKPQDVIAMPFQPVESVADFLAQPAPDFVNQSFRILLGRDPMPTERKSRESALCLGRGRIAMLAEIYHSPEANKYRDDQREQGSDEEFVERTYQHFLRRAADPEGLAHYTNLLQRKSRVAVEAELSTSQEAIDKRSLLHEIDRIATAYRRSRRWWRRFGHSRWDRKVRNIESEVMAAQFFRCDARRQDQMLQAVQAISDQTIRHIDATRVTIRQDIARTKEEGYVEIRAMISRSEEAINALRDQGERALAALDTRQSAFSEAIVQQEAELRAELNQARIETQNALALIRDDAQSRFDRMMESQRAEQAAAAPSIAKVDTSRASPHARHILQRMQAMNTQIGKGRA